VCGTELELFCRDVTVTLSYAVFLHAEAIIVLGNVIQDLHGLRGEYSNVPVSGYLHASEERELDKPPQYKSAGLLEHRILTAQVFLATPAPLLSQPHQPPTNIMKGALSLYTMAAVLAVAQARTFTVKNNCAFTIWPGV
jgi:hypothetical protein